MKLVLSGHHLKKQAEFARFAKEELDSTGGFPAQNLKKAAQKGYMGLPLPKECGGQGEDFLTYILFLEEVSRVCASTGVILAVHTSVGTFPLFYYGSRVQKEKYLKGLAQGEILGAFALTEEGAGSDAAALNLTAAKVKGGYLLEGSKLFITSAGKAGLYTLFARLSGQAGQKGICAFLLEAGLEGLEVGPAESKMGLKRSLTSVLKLSGVRVGAEQLLGKEGEGFKIAMSLLDGGRIGIAAQALGIAGAALEGAKAALKEKEGAEKGQVLSGAEALAGLFTRLEAARLLTYRAAQLKNKNLPCSKEAAMAKVFASELAMAAATKALDLLDLPALAQDLPPERYFCDAKATQIYEGTNQIQRLVIARHLLKA